MFFPTLMGAAVFIACIMWVTNAHSALWRRVSSHYPAGQLPPALAVKKLDQILIVGGTLQRENYVPIRVGIHAAGISFQLYGPFAINCPPIFLPFDDVRAEPIKWYLNSRSFALRAKGIDGTDIIICEKLMNWIKAHTDRLP